MAEDRSAREREPSKELLDQLLTALASRDVIGMAKGILMEREAVTEEEAFQMLVTASQRKNVKLREIARQLVEQREEESRARRR